MAKSTIQHTTHIWTSSICTECSEKILSSLTSKWPIKMLVLLLMCCKNIRCTNIFFSWTNITLWIGMFTSIFYWWSLMKPYSYVSNITGTVYNNPNLYSSHFRCVVHHQRSCINSVQFDFFWFSTCTCMALCFTRRQRHWPGSLSQTPWEGEGGSAPTPHQPSGCFSPSDTGSDLRREEEGRTQEPDYKASSGVSHWKACEDKR